MKTSIILALLLIGCCSSHAQSGDLDLDLIGHYLLDGDDGDATSFENHCLAIGTYTEDRTGVPNAALKLNGDGQYILFPPIITLSEPEWTYSLWIRPDTLSSEVPDMFLLSLNDVSIWDDIPLYIDDTGNDVKTYFASHLDKRSTGVVPAIGAWTHLAISSADDDTVKIYVDGTLKLAHKIDFISTGEESFMLSSLVDLPDTPLKGRYFGAVDDIRIYARAITDDEVATLHDSLWNFVPEPVVPEFVNVQTTLLESGHPIRLYTNADILRVSVYDIQGKEILQSSPYATEDISIPVPFLASGMYVVHAHTPSNIFRGKVMVVR
jgi:hypothetical protein